MENAALFGLTQIIAPRCTDDPQPWTHCEKKKSVNQTPAPGTMEGVKTTFTELNLLVWIITTQTLKVATGYWSEPLFLIVGHLVRKAVELLHIDLSQ
jgi:hypothetical protein